ncbi:Uncharacterised protein [uncultured archaeon]|nr:Uncharacterised protein [uncultured archaeon]
MASLITVTAISFAILIAGIPSTPQAALTNLGILMVFGGLLFVSILLLRIHDKLSEVSDIMNESK